MGSQPEPITREEADERYEPHRSGFAAPDYWTPERREAQREKAKRMIAEGRFGGKPGQGGRPRIKTATEVVAEKAAEKGEQLAKQLINIALNNPDPRRQIEAMDRLLGAEQTVEKNKREDERELSKMEGDELNKLLIERIAELTGETIAFDAESTADEISDEEAEQWLIDNPQPQIEQHSGV